MKLLRCWILFATIFATDTLLAETSNCNELPQGLVFVGLIDSVWETFVVDRPDGIANKINIDAEVRTPVLSESRDTLFYINEEGIVKSTLLKNMKDTVLLKPSLEASYAQPEYDDKNNLLYVVQLKQGKSVDTDIIRLDLSSGEIKPIVIQRSAQFEPFLSAEWLYYSNVHCVVGCGRIIQEIWRFHTVSGIAEQLTLLGNITRQPAVDENAEWLYFSSNVSGNYHIFRQSLENKKLEQLTKGSVTDMSPAISNDTLFFIRHDAQGSHLMCRETNGDLVAMKILKGVTALRDLEIN